MATFKVDVLNSSSPANLQSAAFGSFVFAMIFLVSGLSARRHYFLALLVFILALILWALIFQVFIPMQGNQQPVICNVVFLLLLAIFWVAPFFVLQKMRLPR